MKRKWMHGRRLKVLRLMERVDRITKPVFQCNVCGHFVRHPLDGPAHTSDVLDRLHVVGGGFRPKEQCPFCLSNDRLRFCVEVIKRYTDILSRPCRVLEFAPIGGLESYVVKHGSCEYITGDIVPGRAQRVLDITDIDLPDATFDYVICNHVLEHITDEGRALSEIRRMLKPDGSLLLSMPVALSLDHTLEDADNDTDAKRLVAYGQEDHVRLYGTDVKERLESYEFSVREYIAKVAMPDAVAAYGLIPEDRNYLCRPL